MKKILLTTSILSMLGLAYLSLYKQPSPRLPVVAIANYGPHSSLAEAITGFKDQMHKEGFIEGQTITYEIKDVNFDTSLILPMIASLKTKNPKVMLVMTTPVAQAAKAKVSKIPLVYTVITDPVAAGLLQRLDKPNGNITGSSDQQDLDAFLKFATKLIPTASRVGILYATSEANDTALVSSMTASAKKAGMSVVAIPIDQARDVQIRMQGFKNKVDFIYVGTSGPIQPTLPVISAEAGKMGIPIFNAHGQGVKDGLALASFGVDYLSVGANAGILTAALLRGRKVENLKPMQPTFTQHRSIVNKQVANKLSINIPPNITVVE